MDLTHFRVLISAFCLLWAPLETKCGMTYKYFLQIYDKIFITSMWNQKPRSIFKAKISLLTQAQIYIKGKKLKQQQ